MQVQVTAVDAAPLRERVDDVVAVYKAAFLDLFESNPDRAARDRQVHVGGHLARDDIRGAMALDPAGTLVGFCYAAPGRPGSWWHDVVTRAVGPTLAEEWLSDVLEVVELHVRPAHQGDGLGRRLLRTVLDGASQRTTALSALDDPTLPARHLYAAEGYRPLLEGFAFPGSATRYAILAARLR